MIESLNKLVSWSDDESDYNITEQSFFLHNSKKSIYASAKCHYISTRVNTLLIAVLQVPIISI